MTAVNKQSSISQIVGQLYRSHDTLALYLNYFIGEGWSAHHVLTPIIKKLLILDHIKQIFRDFLSLPTILPQFMTQWLGLSQIVEIDKG